MRPAWDQQIGVPGLLKDTVGQRYFLLPESEAWAENTRFSCVYRTFGPAAPMACHRIYQCCSSKMKTCDHNKIFYIGYFLKKSSLSFKKMSVRSFYARPVACNSQWVTSLTEHFPLLSPEPTCWFPDDKSMKTPFKVKLLPKCNLGFFLWMYMSQTFV